MRIVSANLFFGRADPEAFADLVRELDADVVACQELWSAQADAIARALPYGELEPDDGGYRGMGIALRRPACLGRLPLRFRDARVARLEPSDWPELSEPLEVMNVHVSSPTHPPFWKQHARRARQMQGLLSYLDATPDRRRVVVGDFNATPVWPVYRRMVSRLEDLALAYAREQGRRPERTWSYAPGGPRLLRIDHCFGRNLTVRNVEVHEIRGSDHRAVVADVEPVVDRAGASAKAAGDGDASAGASEAEPAAGAGAAADRRA